MNTNDYLTVDQAAERLGITTPAVYIAIREKRLPARRLFGRLVVHQRDLDAYQARTQADGQPRTARPGRPRKRKSQTT